MSAGAFGPRAALLAMAGFCAAVVGAALVSQHVYEMLPCPWCILQRMEFIAIGVVALIGAAWPPRVGGRAGVWLGLGGATLLSLAGVATAVWHHWVASKSQSCNLTLADRIVNASQLDQWLPAVFQVQASCADATYTLLGVAYPLWGLLGFAAVLALALSALVLSRAAARSV